LPGFGGLGKDESEAAAGLGPVPLPVLQIHASLKCNLSCAHCYSQSGPSATGLISVEAICQLIEDAAQMAASRWSTQG
jgi:MoaA/NifB/PqqE/SkfB family radical SAM enzyme